MKIILVILFLALTPGLMSQPADRQARQSREAFSEGIRKGIDKDFEEALWWLNRAIELDSLYAEAYFYRGLAHFELRQYTRALADFRVSIRLDPDKEEQAEYFMELSTEALREVILAREALDAQDIIVRETFDAQDSIALESLDVQDTIACETLNAHEGAEMKSGTPDLRELAEGFFNASLEKVEPSGIGVQIAILTNPGQVEEISARYSEKFGFPLFIQVVHENGGILYKISVGNFRQREQAVQLRSVMRDEGFLDSFIISYP